MKTVLSFCLVVLAFLDAMAQQPIWSLGFGGTSTEKIKAIARGDAGKIIVTGTLGSQNCDFDPQSGQTLLSTSGGYDIFLASYSDDNLNWAKTLPGVDFNTADDLAVASNGDILVTGTFNDVVNFDPDGTFTLDADTGADAFVARYSSNGAFISAFAITGDNQTTGVSIETDGSGNIYVAGTLTDSADFDPGAGGTPIGLSPSGMFLAKYSATGAYQWVIGVAGTDVKDLEVESDGTAYVTGLFQQTIDLNPGSGTDNVTSDDVDSYLIKISPSGGYEWGRVFTGNDNQVTFGIAHASGFSGPSSEGVYVAGRFNSEIDLDPTSGTDIVPSPTSSNAFVTRLDGDGNYVWGRYIDNQGDGRFIDVEASFTGVHLTGYFNGIIQLPDSSTIFATGGSDILYVAYDDSGNFENHLIFGGFQDDKMETGCSSTDQFYQVFAGHYYGTIDFGPGQDTLSGPTSQGNEDVFLVGYFENPPQSVQEINGHELLIYPNPTTDVIRISTDFVWTNCTISDISGRIVMSEARTNNSIDLGNLPKGMYALSLIADNEAPLQTLVVKE